MGELIEFDSSIERALNMLHHASVYLTSQFSYRMSRDEAKSNLEARATIFNVSNKIFIEHGCGISREEVEGPLA